MASERIIPYCTSSEGDVIPRRKRKLTLSKTSDKMQELIAVGMCMDKRGIELAKLIEAKGVSLDQKLDELSKLLDSVSETYGNYAKILEYTLDKDVAIFVNAGANYATLKESMQKLESRTGRVITNAVWVTHNDCGAMKKVEGCCSAGDINSERALELGTERYMSAFKVGGDVQEINVEVQKNDVLKDYPKAMFGRLLVRELLNNGNGYEGKDLAVIEPSINGFAKALEGTKQYGTYAYNGKVTPAVLGIANEMGLKIVLNTQKKLVKN